MANLNIYIYIYKMSSNAIQRELFENKTSMNISGCTVFHTRMCAHLTYLYMKRI